MTTGLEVDASALLPHAGHSDAAVAALVSCQSLAPALKSQLPSLVQRHSGGVLPSANEATIRPSVWECASMVMWPDSSSRNVMALWRQMA